MTLEDIIGAKIQQLKSLDELEYCLERLLNEIVINEDGRLLSIRQLVDRIKGLKIHIYPNDHPPAHFHVLALPHIDAKYTIQNCDFIDGNINHADERTVKLWFKNGRQVLVKTWNETRPTDRAKDMI